MPLLLKLYRFFAREILLFLTVSIIFIPGVTTVTAANLGHGTDRDIDLVWAGKNADRSVIFLSSKKHGRWSEPEEIIDFSCDSLHPTVDKDNRGNTWLTWTAIDYQQFQIHYTKKQNNQWQEPKKLHTTTENNIAPFLLLDGDDIPFVVWSGNNNDDDDIFFIRFVNAAWQPPRLVHSDNMVPDILPALELNDQQQMRVTWEQYTPSGYVLVSKVWNGSAWVDERLSGKKKTSNAERKFSSKTYAIKGRLWDGRQWIKNTSDVADELGKKEAGNKKDAETIEIELPKGVDNIDSVYVRIYQ